jgi:hypothetical protein
LGGRDACICGRPTTDLRVDGVWTSGPFVDSFFFSSSVLTGKVRIWYGVRYLLAVVCVIFMVILYEYMTMLVLAMV